MKDNDFYKRVKAQLKNWSIDPSTRFLIYKANTPDEQVYTSLQDDEPENQRGLITIYCMLGKELWGAGSLGIDDLVEGLI